MVKLSVWDNMIKKPQPSAELIVENCYSWLAFYPKSRNATEWMLENLGEFGTLFDNVDNGPWNFYPHPAYDMKEVEQYAYDAYINRTFEFDWENDNEQEQEGVAEVL